MPEDGIGLGEVAEELGVTRFTLTRRIAEAVAPWAEVAA
jgi:DNA-binding transcriptional regulator LsrR (DeoR family)